MSLLTLNQAMTKMRQDLLILSQQSSFRGLKRLHLHIKPLDVLCWLHQQKSSIKVFGYHQDSGLSIAGLDKAMSMKGRIKSSVLSKDVFQRMRKVLSSEYPHAQWYGGLSFDAKTYDFVLPLFEIASRGKETVFACNILGSRSIKRILKVLRDISTQVTEPKQIKVPQIIKRLDRPNVITWKKQVQGVLDAISSKELNKVVLARQTHLHFKSSVNPWQLLREIRSLSKHSYLFAFEKRGEVFLGASPEHLFYREGDMLFTQALAGTATSAKKSGDILHSSKDLWEHRIVVNGIKKAILPLTSAIQFESKVQVLRLANAVHLNTPIRARLKAHVYDEDIIRVLHPTPALGGDPKDNALKVIEQSEPFSRRGYGGPVGYIGLGSTHMVVAIRSGYLRKNKMTLFAGAGIVKGSDPEMEWKEIEHKMSLWLKVLKV